MAEKQVKIKHPVFKDVERHVSETELSDWLDSGWLESNQRRKAEVKTADEGESAKK